MLCIKGAVGRAESEEELRIKVSYCVEEMILKPLGIGGVARYEYTIARGRRVIGRLDALYGRVVVEYKAPGGLDTSAKLNNAVKQIVKYIKALSKDYTGVIISDKIVFVKYSDRKGDWIVEGPLDITRYTIARLIDELVEAKMSMDYEKALDRVQAMFVLTVFTSIALYVFGGLREWPLANLITMILWILLPLFALFFTISLIETRKIKKELDEERRRKIGALEEKASR
ncbi:MAG: hypothetical protein ACK4M3_03350 [Pyrobaculum sp.]